MNFFQKYNFLYAPMRYRFSEAKLQTFQYQNSSCTYLEFRGEKYLNTFIVTDANNCPNLPSHGATFRMGVLLLNYPKDMVVDGDNVPHFDKMSGDKMRAPNSTSNVSQIFGDIWKQQLATQSQCEIPESASLSGPPHPQNQHRQQ